MSCRNLIILGWALACTGWAQDPPDPASGLARAEQLLASGRAEEADQVLSGVRDGSERGLLALNLRGRIKAARARWQEAQAAFADALVLAPEDGQLRQNLGVAHFELRQVPDARRELQRALELLPNLVIPHLYLGRIAEEASDCVTAEAEFSRARAKAPTDPWPAYFLRGLLLRERRATEACEAFAAAVATNPNLPAIRWNFGLALARAGRTIEAEDQFAAFKALTDALSQDIGTKHRVASRLQSAQSDLALGRPEAALVYLFEARELAPEVPGTHLLLAECFKRLGKGPEEKAARSEYDRLAKGNR